MRDGWVETNLLDVVEVLDRFRKPVNATERESRQGSVPYYGANGQTGWIDDFLFDEELVLLGEDAIDFADPSARKAYLIDGPSWVNNHAHVLRAKIDKVESYFLAESLNKVDFSQYVSFGTRSKLTQASMNGITIPLPPLLEQKRIIDLISSVDSYNKALQQQLESAKRSRNAVLHEVLTAGGDDWVEHKLIDMFEIYQPQTIAKSLMSEDGEFIVFGANGPIGRYHEFNHDEPEVVVTCRGATCGTVNMTPPKTWITGNAMVVSPKTSEVSKEFLYWALVSGVDIQSVISGSAQPQITREGLAPVKIKIPPLSRQVEIVDLISGFELNISYLEESVHKTKTLRSGLLSDLLSGEHEIPTTYDKVIGTE